MPHNNDHLESPLPISRDSSYNPIIRYKYRYSVNIDNFNNKNSIEGRIFLKLLILLDFIIIQFSETFYVASNSIRKVIDKQMYWNTCDNHFMDFLLFCGKVIRSITAMAKIQTPKVWWFPSFGHNTSWRYDDINGKWINQNRKYKNQLLCEFVHLRV